MKSKRTVTEEKASIIIKEYSTTNLTDKQFADKIDVTVDALKVFLKKNNIKKEHIYSKQGLLTADQKSFIRNNYANMSNKEISDILGIEAKYIRSYACNNGLKKSQAIKEIVLGNELEPKIVDLYKSTYGKYHVNKDYFAVIDNEWKAYWLGFLYADGCNNRKDNFVGLGLKSDDIGHLEKFKDSLQSDAPIKTRKCEASNNGLVKIPTYRSDINICCQKMCEDLEKLGCVPNKTFNKHFPTEDIVPKELIRHFIRGYFDGDGWVSYSTNNRVRCDVGFCCVNNCSFLTDLRDCICEAIGVSRITIKNQDDNKASEICWGGLNDCRKIYGYLYEGCNIYLERKFNKFNEFYYLSQNKA